MKRCKSYHFYKIYVVFMIFVEPWSHWHGWNLKMASLCCRTWNTPKSFLFWQGYLTLNVIINLIFEIYTKLSLIWYIELYVWTNECERESSLSNIERSWRRAHDRWEEFIIIYGFWYHSWGSGNLTIGMYACPYCMLIFKKNCVFD